MLIVEDEARDYLFVLLDHIREHIPEGRCFRLVRDNSGQLILQLSQETGYDDSSEYEGQTVLVWDSEQFADGGDYTLEIDEDDLEEQILLLAKAEKTGARTETVVEIDETVQRILAETT